MIAIIDYGAGNLFSVKNALDYIGEESVATDSIEELRRADGLILPGVGAFPDAMRMLKKSGLADEIRTEAAAGKPLLGICLGMQVLFEKGAEFEETEGLSLIPGTVDRIQTSLKIPHLGYNDLNFGVSCPLLSGVEEGDCVYFVHSYMANTADEYIAASCDYGVKVTALVQNKNVFGAQFHPEKSGAVGLTILKNFGGLTR